MGQTMRRDAASDDSELLETIDAVKVAVVGILRDAGPLVTVYFAESCYEKNDEYRALLSSPEVVAALKEYVLRAAEHRLVVVSHTRAYERMLADAGIDMARVDHYLMGEFQATRYAFACISTVRPDGVPVCWHAPHDSKCGYLACDNDRSRQVLTATARIMNVVERPVDA